MGHCDDSFGYVPKGNENTKLYAEYLASTDRMANVKIDVLNDDTLRVLKLSESAISPTKAYPTDLGYDLYADEDVTFNEFETKLIPTNITLGFPKGYGAIIRDRSGIATKRKLKVTAGIIDETYTGHVQIAMINMKKEVETVKKGEKIAQLILLPTVKLNIVEVNSLDTTDRGSNGFGSSGK